MHNFPNRFLSTNTL